MAFVFHVEFGMNDTPLTQALEQGNYASAERLILDCPNSSYLDDGELSVLSGCFGLFFSIPIANYQICVKLSSYKTKKISGLYLIDR